MPAPPPLHGHERRPVPLPPMHDSRGAGGEEGEALQDDAVGRGEEGGGEDPGEGAGG